MTESEQTEQINALTGIVTELYVRQQAILDLILHDQLSRAVVDTVILKAIEKARIVLAANFPQASGSDVQVEAIALSSAFESLKEQVLLLASEDDH